MYIYICICMYIHLHIYMYINLHVCVHIYMYIYLHVCVHTYTCVYAYISVCIYMVMSGSSYYRVHPKTLFEMWITCLDRVSANSETGRLWVGWAIRVGQRLQSRFGQRLELEGVCQALSRLSLFLAGAVTTFCGDYGEGLRLRPHGQKHIQTLALDLC